MARESYTVNHLGDSPSFVLALVTVLGDGPACALAPVTVRDPPARLRLGLERHLIRD